MSPNLELTDRCNICHCYMDSEDLFCANCGTENPRPENCNDKLDHQASHHSFSCDSCGASMSYDASAQALRCPFCGSTSMKKREGARSVVPQGVVLFDVDQARAESILREWLGQGFWRPSDAARASEIGEMTAVYIPYWVFEAKTKTRWTADSSVTPAGSRGTWYPVAGNNRADYQGVLIAGSSVLTHAETESIAPFRLADLVKPDQVDLEHAIFEEFLVPRKLARPRARAAVEWLEQAACAAKVPGRNRNLRVNVQFSSMRGQPMLLPVWILAYRYKGKVNRVLVNGQTGKIAGTAPFSYAKLSVILIAVVAFLALIAAIAILANQ